MDWTKVIQLFVKYRLTAANIPLVADEIEKRGMPVEAAEHRELAKRYRQFADDLETALLSDGADLTKAHQLLKEKEDTHE